MSLFVLLLFSLRSATQALPPPTQTRDLGSTDALSFATSSTTSPDSRSIWDIVWSCLAVIFACAWVAVHPNILSRDTRSWRLSLRRLQYMAYTILVPEIVLYWAMTQYLAAHRYAARYRDHGWTTTHAHFLQMGGFVLYDGDRPVGVITDTFSTSPLTLEAAYHLGHLVDTEQIKFPDITKAEIEDKSKSDGLSKAIATGQTTWFILQCSVRLGEGLVITQLELVTLALAALNAGMYFFWWNKPYNVQTQVPVFLIKAGENQAIDGESELSKRPPGVMWAILAILFGVIESLGQMTELAVTSFRELKKSDHVPMFYSLDISHLDPQTEKRLLTISIIGIAFGAIHVAGWNLRFPTGTERVMWRVSSLLIASLACVPAAQALTELLSSAIHSRVVSRFLRSVHFHLHGLFVWIAPIYLVARLLLLVLASIALRDLPQGAYAVVNWTTNLPHI